MRVSFPAWGKFTSFEAKLERRLFWKNTPSVNRGRGGEPLCENAKIDNIDLDTLVAAKKQTSRVFPFKFAFHSNVPLRSRAAALGVEMLWRTDWIGSHLLCFALLFRSTDIHYSVYVCLG